MKTGTHQLYSRVLFFCLCSVSFGAIQWQLQGLANRNILSVIVDSDKSAIAGTDSGLFIKTTQSKEWLEIPTPVRYCPKIIEVKKGELIALLGNGLSNADGIYTLTAVDTVTRYRVKRLVSLLDKPQALILSENGLYAGSGNKIFHSIRDTDSQNYMPLTSIKTPQNCFGVDMPVCAALLVWTQFQNKLYAGGFDASPDPGKSAPVFKDQDSMRYFLPTLIKLKVTTLCKFDSTSLKMLCLGTRDTGVMLYSPIMSSLPRILAVPNNEPVNDMMPVGINSTTDILMIAVKSGVYVRQNDWMKIGDLQAEPNNLFLYKPSLATSVIQLYAGTKKGLYTIAIDPTAIAKNTFPASQSTSFAVQAVKNSVHVTWTTLTNAPVSFTLLSATGRVLYMVKTAYYRSGENSINFLAGPRQACGVFLVHAIIDNRSYIRPVCIYQ